MPIDADLIVEHITAQKAKRMWRWLAIIAFLLLAVAVFRTSPNEASAFQDHIARIRIDGIVYTEPEKILKLNKLAKDDNVKALIIHLNTPGGTAVGGERLYHAIKHIAKTKPVGVVMEDIATSAGYLIAVGGDYVVASHGTITGSIGVIMESPNVAGLSKKLGITMQTITSGEKKNVPSLFEPLEGQDRLYLEAMLNDFHQVFKEIVQEERELDAQEIEAVADGRVFSGRQALKAHLIDAIGDESHVVRWLETEKNIKGNLAIIDRDIEEKNIKMPALLQGLFSISGIIEQKKSNGLLLLWK